MVPGRRRITVFFFPKFIRFYAVTKKADIGEEPSAIMHSTNEPEAEAVRLSSPHHKQLSFVPPRLDESKLIIEEIRMGSANGPQVQLGSKVVLRL